ncbi:MAG: TetR/AcrR family transcriptional regulator [Pseudomonadota bacterium]
MPRPSLKAERQAEILEAYGRCIARYGVEGATLEKTADEAGLARALIRHNIGNKEDLLEAFIERFLATATASAMELFTSLPRRNRLDTLLKSLFDPAYTDAEEVSVTNALMTAAIDRPALAATLREWTDEFSLQIAKELETAFPNAGPGSITAAATGIAALYFHLDSMVPLGDVEALRAACIESAKLLISTLAD